MRLALEVADFLAKHDLKIALAESCTGGMIAAALTDIPGASKFFECGFVTYSNESKEKLLGVDKNIIAAFGAVSKECARAMAEGAVGISGADISVSVTGIAGPDGGSTQKPVGLVYIALAKKGYETQIMEFHFSGDRSQIRAQATENALQIILNSTV